MAFLRMSNIDSGQDILSLIYCNKKCFIRAFQTGQLVPNVYQLEKMQTKVSSLCYRISELPSKTAMDRQVLVIFVLW